MLTKGYNLSSDDTCDFGGPGDLNDTDPKLGRLQNNGGFTSTMALLQGSPAIVPAIHTVAWMLMGISSRPTNATSRVSTKKTRVAAIAERMNVRKIS